MVRKTGRIVYLPDWKPCRKLDGYDPALETREPSAVHLLVAHHSLPRPFLSVHALHRPIGRHDHFRPDLHVATVGCQLCEEAVILLQLAAVATTTR